MLRTSFLKLNLILIFVLVALACLVSSSDHSLTNCEAVVTSWANSAITENPKEDKSTLKDLLFFLHVPRTGGRTYYHCFLRSLYAGKEECPRSYDKLRFDPSKSNCKLLVSHDDYSFMTKLPEEKTSVLTVLRNPIDRVFSTYEFAVEVASRFLVHPNVTSATLMSSRIRRKSRGVSTLDIWPWKYLVPWMREDLFARRDARKQREEDVLIARTSNPYNVETVVMPLEKFIDHPVVQDIVHNGATFQVAGLTNNSWMAGAHKVRHCVNKYPELGHHVLEIAKRRLDNMLYVGLTEDHRESATLFVNMVGAQVLSQSNSHLMAQNSTEPSGVPNPLHESSHMNITGQAKTGIPPVEDSHTDNGTMTVTKLAESYERCTSKLRKSQVGRHSMSLKHIYPVNFSKETRNKVPEAVLQRMSMLNNLDVELYKHAKHVFQKQHEFLQGTIGSAGSEREPFVSEAVQQNDKLINYYQFSIWKLSLAIFAIISVFIYYIHVIARRRASKLKM